MSEQPTLENFLEENARRLDSLLQDVRKWRAERDELDAAFMTYGTVRSLSKQRLEDLLVAALDRLAGHGDG